MTFDTWLKFAIPTFLICITPGPNMLLMLAMGLRHGLRGTIPAMLGAMIVVLLMLVASALGLGLLLEKSPAAFTSLTWLGAAYLAWLGLQMIFTKLTGDGLLTETAIGVAVEQSPKVAPFWITVGQAMAVAGSNPKAIVFAAAYFPQFIDASQSAWRQLAVLLPTFVVFELLCYLLYAQSGKNLARWFAAPGVLRRFNVAIGLVFIAFGLLMVRR